MPDRFELRARYIAGWYEMDLEKLLSSTTEDFLFDDPAEPAAVTRLELSGYMLRWHKRANSKNEWILQHEVR